MPDYKQYKLGVGVDKKSLDRIRKDLADVIKPFEEAMKNVETNGLTGESKGKVKAELSSLFKLTEKQAKALQDMVNGLIPSDDKGIDKLKKNVQDLATFMTDAMQRMSQLGKSEDWMKSGVSFVDAFTHMKDVLKVTEQNIGGLETSIVGLTSEFKVFKEALATVNPEAFGKRFAAEIHATTDGIKKAQDLIKELEKQEHKGIQGALKVKKDDEFFSYLDYDANDLKQAHSEIQDEIAHHLATIAKIEAQYANQNKSPYASKEYREAVHGLYIELQNFENLKLSKSFENAFVNVGSEASSSIRNVTAEITTATEGAVRQIKEALKDVEGIELEIKIPEANSVEFTSKINAFVQEASKQFEKNPVKINLDFANPFKDGSKKVTKYQKKKAEEAKKVISDENKTEENLAGLDTQDTSRIIRGIIESFKKIKDAVNAGQQDITSATKAWRKELEQELTLRAKFNNSDVKDEAIALMRSLQKTLDENPPLFIDAEIDIDSFIEDIQDALKEVAFNIKVDKIDGAGATIDATRVKLGASASGNQQSSGQQKDAQQSTTTHMANVVKKNSEELHESTQAQSSMKDAMKQLQDSIDNNTERNTRSEEDNAKRRATAEANATQIAALRQQKDELRSDDSASNKRSDLKRQLAAAEEERDAALQQIAGRVTSVQQAFKDGDVGIIENEFQQATQFLQAEKDVLLQSIENIKTNANIKDKHKKIGKLEASIASLDKLLDPDEDKENVILEALRLMREKQRTQSSDAISALQTAIQSQDRAIINTNNRITNIVSEIDALSQETAIDATDRRVKQRESQSKHLQQRKDNIQSVLDANESPVQLVFDEVQEFWKKSYKTIEKTKAELEDLKNGKYSDDLKKKLEGLTEAEQKEVVQGLIASKNKRITDWETRQTLMAQMGLGSNLVTDKDGNFKTEESTGKFVRSSLEDALKSFTVESLTDVLKNNPTLSDALLRNSNLKSLSSIQDIAYYAGVAQDAMGFRTQTGDEYVDEKTLQAKLVELARIATFTEKVKAMFPGNGGTPELKGIEDFIAFFEKIAVAPDTIASIVEQAKTRIGNIEESLVGKSTDSVEYQNKQLEIARLQSIIDKPLSAIDAAKDYLTSFKNFASTIDGDDRFAVGSDGRTPTAAQMAQTIWDSLDSTVRDTVTKAMLSSSEFANTTELKHVNVAGVLEKMTKVFETGALKDINSDDKAYQQLVALLDRQSKFQRARTVSDLQYGGSIKSSLHTAGTLDKPIYVRVVGSHGEETTYDIHNKKSGSGNTDKSFTTSAHGIGRLLKNLGIEEEMGQIVSAMFNDPELAQTLIDNLFASHNIQLSNKKLIKKSAEGYGFDATPLGSNLEQREKLEKEIEALESGKYSQWVLKSIEGLSGDDRTAKIQSIIANKKAELESLKQLNLTEEEISQSLVVLANDIDIDKAKLKDARRTKKRSSRREANLIEDGSKGWAYANRVSTEKRQAEDTARQIRSGTKGSSQHLTNPLQQLIDSVNIAKQYGLMDTSTIDDVIAKYQEAYEVARNMPRVKDTGTSEEMAKEINAAWDEEQKLREQLIDMFYDSDGSFGTQLAKEQINVILAEAERAKQEARNKANSTNAPVESQLANIASEKARAELAADELEATLQEKYIRNPYRDVAIAAEQNERAIAEKTKEIEAKKLDLYNTAYKSTELKDEEVRLGKLQDEELAPLREELRNTDSSDKEGIKAITARMEAIKQKYTEQYKQAKQAWIDKQSAQLDEELRTFVDSMQNAAVADAESRAVGAFNVDMADKGIHVNSMEEIKEAIQTMVRNMYQAAANQAEQAKASVDQSGLVAKADVDAEIAQIEEKTKRKIAEVIASIVGKSDATLMANSSYGKVAENASKEADDLKDAVTKKEQLLNKLLSQYGLTREMLRAETKAFEDSNEAAEQMQGQPSDSGSGGYGGGYLGAIDTSNLAKESTLRGIYELLNGGAPAGGWGDANNSNATNKDNNLGLSEINTFIKDANFAKSLKALMDNARSLSKEYGTIIGNGHTLSTFTSNQSRQIQGEDIIRAIKGTNEKIDFILHNHPSGEYYPSIGDLNAGRILSDHYIPVKGTGVYSDSGVTLMDLSGIPTDIVQDVIEESISKWAKDIEKDGLSYDFEHKQLAALDERYADLTKEDMRNVALDTFKKLYSSIADSFAKKGYKDVFKSFTYDEIAQMANPETNSNEVQQAITQVANNVIESGAQAAVEATKNANFTKDDISAQQAKFQEKFKTKELKNGKKGFEIYGANRIDQAFYNIGDRLTQSALTDYDLSKLEMAYDQLTKALGNDIGNQLDSDVKEFIEKLRGQVADVLQANAGRLTEIAQQKKSVRKAQGFLTHLQSDNDGILAERDKLKDNIESVYGVLNKDTNNLSEKDLISVAQGYYHLQEVVNHEIFEKLNDNTKQVINNAIQEAQSVLDKYRITVNGSELIGTTIDNSNKDLFLKAEKDKKRKVGKVITSVAQPQVSKNGEIISNASVYLGEASKKKKAESEITEEKKKQNELAAEAVKKEEKTATQAQEQAKAEKKKTEAKKEGKATSTDSNRGASGTQTTNNGGILGLLGQIAKEDTLKSILDILVKGVKTTGGDGGSGKKKTESDLTVTAAEDAALAYIRKNYPGAQSLGNLKPTANGYSIDVFAPRAQEIAKAQEEINRLEAAGKKNTDEYVAAQARLNGLKKEQEKITLRISNVNGKVQVSEKKTLQNLAVGTKAASKELQVADDMMSRLHGSGALSVGGDGDITSNNNAINNYLNSLKALINYQDQLSEEDLLNPATEQRLSELALATQNARKEVTLLLNAFDNANNGDLIETISGPLGNDDGAIRNQMKDIIAAGTDMQATFGELTPIMKGNEVVSYQLAYSLKTGKHEVQEMTASLNPLTGELRVQKGAVKEVATGWEKFMAGFKGKLTSITQYLLSMVTINDALRYMRQGVQYVREIDSALTELKKVTDETDRSYSKFLQDMAKTGSVIGATVKDLTTMAADWAKLGYSMEAAGKLAKSTAVLLNVSEFQDANSASEALISTMQAFGYAADESMHVVDVLNEVGNNYAITSDGIATALQDSASALMEGGNNLEQAVALVAAANKVVQDPNSVGSALRTISLRLRGTSVKVLEEMGEETDGVVESISKMQSKIEALTGVDILTNSGDYKDTYTILQEIGRVWEDMSDIDQAALLELMAGKNRANTLAAILGNMEDLEGAYNDALKAEGSALKENEAYLDSIQGRIDLFNNSVQTMWMNFIDSEVVKGVVDLGTGLIKLVDNIGLIQSAIIALTATMTIFKKKDFGWITALQEIFSAKKANPIQLLSGDDLAQQINGLNEAAKQGPEAFNKYRTSATSMKNGIYQLTQTVDKAEYSQEDYTQALKHMSEETQKAAAKQQLLSTAINVGIVVATTAAMSLINNFRNSIKSLEEEYEELQSSISTLESDIESFDSELSTIQERIEELSGKPLTITEAEELKKLQEQNKELKRQKELRESILEAREKQNEAKSLAMINNYLRTGAAYQKEATESGKQWGKVIGQVVGALAGLAVGVGITAGTAGTGAGAGVAAGAATSAGVSTAITMGLSSIGSSLGGLAGESIGGSIGSGSHEADGSLIGWYESYTKAIQEAEQKAIAAESEYFSTMSDESYKNWQDRLDEVTTLQTEMYDGLEEMQEYIGNLEYNEQTKSVIDGYNKLLSHIDVKSNEGNIDAQIASIEALKSEFYELSRGVDANGKNVALSTEEYAKYCNIVDQILTYTPGLIIGYDESGNAILGAADAQYTYNQLLAESIGLLKQQQKEAAISATSNKSISDIITSYTSGRKKMVNKLVWDTDGPLPLPTETYNSAYVYKDYLGPLNVWDFLTGEIKHDVTFKDMTKVIEKKVGISRDFLQGDGKFIKDNAVEISKRRDEITEEIYNAYKHYEKNPGELEEYIGQYNAWIDSLIDPILAADAEANKKLRETLYLAPQRSDYYGDLSGSQMSFINTYISGFEDLHKKSESEILNIRNDIVKLTDSIGQSESAQKLIDSLFEIDASKMPIEKYRSEINGVFDKLISDGVITHEMSAKFYEQLFPDFNNIDIMKTDVAAKLKETSKGLVDNLTLPELKIAWTHRLDFDDGSLSFEELQQEIAKHAEGIDGPIVKTYSALQEQAKKYTDILSQSSEILINNVEVTQEYKDSLIDLGVSSEELNECFDGTNKLVVTNVKRLQELVMQARQNTAQNVALAKSQTRLQYYELYKEMSQYIDAEGKITGATKEQIAVLYAEMGVLQKTIAQYAVLEAKLLGTTNAYEKFQEAQNADAETDYVTGVEEMVVALGEAFNTGELGTETAKAAIEGLVPDSVIAGLSTVEGKLDAINKYVHEGKLAQYFDLEFDDDGNITSAEMKLGNLRKFIEDGLTSGVFTGEDWTKFEFSDAFIQEIEKLDTPAQKLDAFAKKFKVTRDVAFAIIESINDHDADWLNGDYSSMFEQFVPSTLEDKIFNAMEAIADLNAQLANGKIDADQYSTKLAELQKELIAAKEASIKNLFGEDGFADGNLDDVDGYLEASKKVEEATEDLEKANNKLLDAESTLNEKRKEGLTGDELKQYEEDVVNATKEVKTHTDKLNAAIKVKNKFATPTEAEIKIALEDINTELSKFGSEYEEALGKYFERDSNNRWIVKASMKFELENEKNYTKIMEYVNLLNSRTELTATVNPQQLETEVQKVKNQLEDVINVLKNINISLDDESVQEIGRQLGELFSPRNIVIGVTGAIEGAVEDTGNWISDGLVWIGGKLGLANGTANASGTAHATGNWGLPTNETDSLVGELGPELVVDPQSGRYYTVGDNGAEMVNLKRGSIIFNHKQTESLLKNGHITSRGKAYAEGNAHAVTIYPNATSTLQWTGTGYSDWLDETYNLTEALESAADSAKNFDNSLDWIAIRMDEFEERIGLLNARLENAIGVSDKNDIIQQIIQQKKQQKTQSEFAAGIYADKAESYLTKLPNDLKEFARNGALAISDIPKELTDAQKATIENYRNYAGLSAEMLTQAETNRAEIADLALQKFNNVAEAHDTSLTAIQEKISKTELNMDINDGGLDLQQSIDDTSGYYDKLFNYNKNTMLRLSLKRKGLQETLDAELASGNIKLYSDEWHEMTAAIESVDTEILQCSADMEDLATEKFDAVSKEFENQIGKLRDANDLIEAGIENMEQKGFANVNAEYEKMINNVDTVRSKLEKQADDMQTILDVAVKKGHIKEGSDEWYEMVAAISDVRAEAESCTTEIEELATKKLDTIVNEFESISEAIDSSNDILKAQIDLMENLGYEVIGEKFNKMLGNTGDKLNTLQNEYVNLYQAFQDEVSAGRIAKDSEAYNEWQEKLKALKVEITECNAELEDLAKQKFDSITNQFDNQIGLTQNLNEALQDQIDLQEESGNIASPKYYEEMIGNTKDMQSALIEERDALQAVLDEQVKAGNIKVGSDVWYEMVEAINDVNSEITQSVADLEQFQNAINDIHWDNFDEFIKRIDYVNNETQNIVDLLSEADMVVTPETEDGWNASDVKWTDEGITTLAMYAQQMETAEYKAQQYAEQIDELTKQYEAGRYSEAEYLEKLNELKDAQYDSIEAYQDAKKAIVDLNKARVDEIKNGINKQVEAYEKLINKKKELLNADKD